MKKEVSFPFLLPLKLELPPKTGPEDMYQRSVQISKNWMGFINFLLIFPNFLSSTISLRVWCLEAMYKFS